MSAQTALRESIGRHELAQMITERETMGRELQRILDEKTNPWGITVQSVEIRDVHIPAALEDAMSRQAQAERERQAPAAVQNGHGHAHPPAPAKVAQVGAGGAPGTKAPLKRCASCASAAVRQLARATPCMCAASSGSNRAASTRPRRTWPPRSPKSFTNY